MLIAKGDGTHLVGPADLVCILHDHSTNRYHVAFFEESPLPGPVKPLDQMGFLRLKSKMHHTGGAPTLQEAEQHVVELRKTLDILDSSVLLEPLDWDGQMGLCLISTNWLREKRAVRMTDLGVQPVVSPIR